LPHRLTAPFYSYFLYNRPLEQQFS
jgi:hypothetical protein